MGSDNESLSSIKSGDWGAYKYLDFGKGVSFFRVNAHSYTGGFINLRVGSPAGKIIGTVQIAPLSKRNKYDTFSCKVDNIKGVHALFLEFVGIEKGAMLFDLDSFQFE